MVGPPGLEPGTKGFLAQFVLKPPEVGTDPQLIHSPLALVPVQRAL